MLVALGTRAEPPAERLSDNGRLRLISRWRSFDDAVQQTFAGIRHYGASDPAVMRHLLQTLAQIAPLLPPGRRGAIRDEARRVVHTAGCSIGDPVERSRVTRVGDDALAVIAGSAEESAPPS